MEELETKHQNEIDAINGVYDKSKYSAYGIKRPDFKLIRKEDFYTVGAEVTRMYFNEATARLKNIPTYREEILTSNRYRQKDYKYLKTDSITFPEKLDDSGNPIKFPVVMYIHPQPPEFLEILKNRILDKETKYSKFTHTFNKLELIIKDEEDYFVSITINDFSNLIFKDSVLNNSIQFSRFNEIYLFGQIVGQEQFIPLKKALFGYRAALVCEFYLKNLTHKIFFHEFPDFFLTMMKSLGYIMIAGFKVGNKTTFLYENYQMQISPNNIRALIIENHNYINTPNPIPIGIDLVEKYKEESIQLQLHLSQRITLLDPFIFKSFRDSKNNC